MGMAEIKEKHPTWFKMKAERRQLVRELPAETTAKVLLACWEYLETAEIPATLNPLERIAFSAFFPDLEESWRLYEQRIGTKIPPNNSERPSDTGRYHTMPHGTEPEPETEGRGESKEDSPSPALKNFSGDQRVYDYDDSAYKAAKYLAEEKLAEFPGRAQPTERELQRWAQALQELSEENMVKWKTMAEVMDYSLDSEWWGRKVQSAFDFKKHFNSIFADMVRDRGNSPES